MTQLLQQIPAAIHQESFKAQNLYQSTPNVFYLQPIYVELLPHAMHRQLHLAVDKLQSLNLRAD